MAAQLVRDAARRVFVEALACDTRKSALGRGESGLVSTADPHHDRVRLSQASHLPTAGTCLRSATPWALLSTCLEILVRIRRVFRVTSQIRESVPYPYTTSTSSTMAAPEAVTSLIKSSAALISDAAESAQTSLAAMKAAETAPSSTFGILGRVILSILSVLPTILFWVTYTLPTWLFTLFSMSLTFTMNFTTL